MTKFKCTKNLVLGSQIIIMKHDIIKILGDVFMEDESGDGGKTYYDIDVLVSSMCQEMELSINIFQLAEHFEYLSYETMQTSCRNV